MQGEEVEVAGRWVRRVDRAAMYREELRLHTDQDQGCMAGRTAQIMRWGFSGPWQLPALEMGEAVQ